ncbi:DUF2202 domain-containing protein [Gaetbulibacter aquiaggeris]|uniref:DUF2202 domain-containing protein n=1 Tax=Gaetbulibacter aquiaggeris TaxID=1735373 RepID=A0ABW7MT37_9FLAO
MKIAFFKITFIIISLLSFDTFCQGINLSTHEVSDMKYMLEEEKLARDVYEILDAKWQMRVFNNIKQSEQHHMDMMEYLLNSYKIRYKLNFEQGVFYNEQLQTMYNNFIEKGSKSRQDALEVGKMIEVVDIEDLEKAIKKTSKNDIHDVYSKLIFASNNHLRAFNRNLSRF